MKKTAAVICAIVLVLSLASCGKSTPDYALGTVWGEITKINGTKVTLTLGKVKEENVMPDMAGDNAGGIPPEMPSGEAPAEPNGQSGSTRGESGGKPGGGSGNGGTPPEKPGNAGSGDIPSMPGGEAGGFGMQKNVSFTAGSVTLTVELADAVITEGQTAISVSDLAVGKVLCVSFGEDGKAASAEVVSIGTSEPSGGQNPGNGGGMNGGGTKVDQGSSANTVSENGSYSGKTFVSTGDNENALRIDGATVDFDNITVDKSAGATSNAENGDFYGVNAAILSTNGATVTIKNSTVTSATRNGNGVFSYGSGTTVNIHDTKITTTADNSGGIQTTGGGTTNAYDLTVNTSGNSSAAIRSDRGGGTVTVSGGSYTSAGYNSPAVYSTAAIAIRNAILAAGNSEALVIEGKNSITLENCTVSGNMSAEKSSSGDINVHNVMLYQSMSGDADVGTSSFSMTGGKLTGNRGDMIFVTNTNAVIYMSGVTVENIDASGAFLRVSGNNASHGWGTAGKNGAEVEFTADAQTLTGDIIVDSISTLDLTLKNGSVFTGTVNITPNAEGGTAVADSAMVTVGEGCVWNLTGDCTVTSLTNNGTINFGGYIVTLANGTVLRG